MTTEKQLVARFYQECLNTDSGADTSQVLHQILAEEFVSKNAAESKSKSQLTAQIGLFWKLMPDLTWKIKDMIQEGNQVVVRSEFSGSPSGHFMGLELDGTKKFNTMAIDIHTVEDNKIASVYHLEEWLTAITQLK
jgi:predicted ester cyclase